MPRRVVSSRPFLLPRRVDDDGGHGHCLGKPSKYDRAILLKVIDEATFALDDAIADVDKLLAQ